ncbi:MAG: hypothetical protein A4E55_02401 [Pelotomaculum sp. PtaU1.Bin035]|nr:MAG: hypothetical protein A4E55_02401 [Pelotomaculum sp. PtaU1.Bin035]
MTPYREILRLQSRDSAAEHCGKLQLLQKHRGKDH